jgi:hypothetical protein
MAEEGSNLKLMWVPAHVGIKGNETVDKAAKEALNLKVDNTYKVVKSDWSKWVKRKSWQVRQDEWKLRKPHGDRGPPTATTSRVIEYIIKLDYGDDPKPYCNECEQDVMVWDLLWQCRNFNTQRTKLLNH